MARNLHDQVSTPIPQPSFDYGRGRSPQPPLAAPGYPRGPRDPSRGPPPGGQEWTPWAGISSPPPPSSQPFPGSQYSAAYSPRPEDVSSSMASLSLGPQPLQQPHHSHQHSQSRSRAPSAYNSSPPQIPQLMPQAAGPSQSQQYYPPSTSPPARSPPRQNSFPAGPPSLTAPLPTVSTLTSALPSVQQQGGEPTKQIAWCRDVLSLVSRAENLQSVSASANPTNVAATDAPVGPVRISDPALQRLVDVAVPLILRISTPSPMPSPMPTWLAESIYHRATCEASGAFPQYIPQSSRSAFRDFEQAARNGFHAAWFKLGRDYENFKDVQHAKSCFERGLNHGDERCLYVRLYLRHGF